MNAWSIPDFWLTGLGSWAVSYLLHSSAILGCILVLTHFFNFFSESSKDVLLKIGLVAGIFTASWQFVQSSNGIAVNTLMVSLEPSSREVILGSPGRVLNQDGLFLTVPAIAETAEASAPINWLQWLLLAWLSGSCFLTLRFIYLWQVFNRRIGDRTPLTHQPTLQLCERLKTQMKVRRSIKMTCSAHITSPMAIGLSQICIPEGLWQQVDDEQLTAIIAHELAHLSRTDPLWLFFWHLMGVVFFFQPLNKLAQLSFQSRAEFLADATAVRQTKDPVAMVNSLLSAAKLVGNHLGSNLTNLLLGHNATIVSRAKLLLADNPIKTKISLPIIVLLATLIVALSGWFLPSVSLTRRADMTVLPQYGQLNASNAEQWTEFDNTSLRFKTNMDHSQSMSGVQLILKTRLVTFGYNLDGIAYIEPGGQLRFVRQSIYSHEVLVIEADFQGNIWYQYKVSGERVNDIAKALIFMQKMLDDGLGKSDEFKRNMLQLFIEQPHTVEPSASISYLFSKALSDPKAYLSQHDLAVIDRLQHNIALFSQGELPTKAQSPRFFNAMAHSGDWMASFNDFGYLVISPKNSRVGKISYQYNLNNRPLLQLFAQANSQNYVPGTSEKALVHFLVRLHFELPENDIKWLE